MATKSNTTGLDCHPIPNQQFQDLTPPQNPKWKLVDLPVSGGSPKGVHHEVENGG